MISIAGIAAWIALVSTTQLFAILLNQLCHQGGPAGLMAGTDARTIIAVEILVERNQVAPVRIVLKLLSAAEDRPPPVLIAAKDAG